jgi:septal ring factor EnvC (AmiA/AmiB activator)
MTMLNLALLRVFLAADKAGDTIFSPSTLVASIAAVAALGGTYLTYRTSQRANLVNSKKVDLEEHRDSLARLQAIITEQDKHQDRLRFQLDRLNSQLDNMQAQLAREQDVSAILRQQIATLQDQVRTLQRMVDERGPRRAAADRAARQAPKD